MKRVLTMCLIVVVWLGLLVPTIVIDCCGAAIGAVRDVFRELASDLMFVWKDDEP